MPSWNGPSKAQVEVSVNEPLCPAPEFAFRFFPGIAESPGNTEKIPHRAGPKPPNPCQGPGSWPGSPSAALGSSKALPVEEHPLLHPSISCIPTGRHYWCNYSLQARGNAWNTGRGKSQMNSCVPCSAVSPCVWSPRLWKEAEPINSTFRHLTL